MELSQIAQLPFVQVALPVIVTFTAGFILQNKRVDDVNRRIDEVNRRLDEIIRWLDRIDTKLENFGYRLRGLSLQNGPERPLS